MTIEEKNRVYDDAINDVLLILDDMQDTDDIATVAKDGVLYFDASEIYRRINKMTKAEGGAK